MRNTTIGCFAERVAKGDDCHSVKTKAKPPEAAASGGFLRRNGTDEPYYRIERRWHVYDR